MGIGILRTRKKVLVIGIGLLILGLVIAVVGLGIRVSVLEKDLAAEREPEVVKFKPEQFEAGTVGEIKDQETGERSFKISPTMPPVIFSTTGTITEIKSDRLIVRGKGTNFADGMGRDLTLIFTARTTTSSKDQTSVWKGKEGLERLEKGMRILIGSQQNIRGKVEFEVKTINIL